MKKIISIVLFFTALPVLAASTCQQRVDQNLQKGTAQKVSLCLTPEKDLPVAKDTTRVIYSEVTSLPGPSNQAQNKTENKKPKLYEPEEQTVNQKLVEKKYFPPFVNDIPSSADAQAAHNAALRAISYQRAHCPARSDVKPARKVKTTVKPAAVQNTSLPQTPSVLLERPTQTPLSELAEAQALENNPLEQNNTDGAAAPAGFVQDNLVTGESFGHNNTDPAFQP